MTSVEISQKTIFGLWKETKLYQYEILIFRKTFCVIDELFCEYHIKEGTLK